MSRIIVTGGSGYIGSKLTKSLIEHGYEVCVLVRSSSNLYRLDSIKGQVKVEFYNGKYSSIKKVFTSFKPDAVIHLAAETRIVHEEEKLDLYVDANIRYGLHVLEAMKQTGVSKFINTGSYWQHDNDEKYRANTVYAAAKEAFIQIIKYYVDMAGLAAITLKLYNVYGEDDDREKLFTHLDNAHRDGVSLDMTPGEQKISMVHIDDVIDGYIQALKLLETMHGQYAEYYMPAAKHSLREIVDIYQKASNREVKINWGVIDYRSNQVMDPYIGPSVPGWRATISLAEGVRRAIYGNK